jgi:hypothetical protein
MYNRLAPKRGPSLTSNSARKPMGSGAVSIALIALGNNASHAGATAPRIRRGMGRAESQRRKARTVGTLDDTRIAGADVWPAAAAWPIASTRQFACVSMICDFCTCVAKQVVAT